MKRIGKNTILVFFTAAILLFGITGCAKADTNSKESFSVAHETTAESDEYLEINLDLPALSGFETAPEINKMIAKSMDAAKKEVEEAAESMKEAGGGAAKAGLGSSFQYSQSGDIVSLWIMWSNYTGGAHGLYWIEPYTFNISTNEIYQFQSLFQKGKDLSMITDKILSEITESQDYYFPEAKETVKNYKGGYPFYINGNKITVFFSLYEIAPYAAGIRYFEFDAEELKELLKPEIYNAIKDTEPVETGESDADN